MSDHLSRAQAYRLYLIAAAGLIGMYLLAAAVPIGRYTYSIAYYLLCLALPLFMAVKKRGCIDSLRPYPVLRGTLLPVLLLPFPVLIVVNTVSLLWQIPFDLMGAVIRSNVPVAADTRGLLIDVLLAGALPAVCEEFLFRGAILSALEPYGTKRAILVSSILFTLLHGSIVSAPGIFILSVIMGVITVCTGSIYGSIIYHTLHNALSIVLVYTQRGAAQNQPVLQSIGGTAGLLRTVFSASLYALAAFFFLRALLRRARMLKVRVCPPKPDPIGGGRAALIGSGAAVVFLFALNILSMIPGVIE